MNSKNIRYRQQSINTLFPVNDPTTTKVELTRGSQALHRMSPICFFEIKSTADVLKVCIYV